MSPFLSVLLSWVLPILLFVGLGQMMAKRMMNKAGGSNSMMFGMGRSNAKVYVKSLVKRIWFSWTSTCPISCFSVISIKVP